MSYITRFQFPFNTEININCQQLVYYNNNNNFHAEKDSPMGTIALLFTYYLNFIPY